MASSYSRAGISTKDAWHARKLTRGAIGAAMSVLLHSLFFVPLLLGASGHQRPAPLQPVSLQAAGADAGSAMSVVSLDLPDPQAAALAPAQDFKPELAAIATPEVIEPQDLGVSTDSGDPPEQPGQAEIFGRYMGQINARIDRAWLRPRGPLTGDSFSCRVRIEQDANGRVGEITLIRCNSDTRWQVSLVRAIESASPLPPPPDPAVFTRTFTLTFTAKPYSSDVAQELYEPAAPASR
jgi:hypothetical protein